MGVINSAPCLNCKKRQVGCHGKCEDYAAFVAKNEERKKLIFEEKEIQGVFAANVRAQAKRSGKYLRNMFF